MPFGARRIGSAGFLSAPQGPLCRMRGTHKGLPFVTLCMTHRNAKIRPAITAIAAVLAFSSTALIAQVAPDVAQPATQAPAIPVDGKRPRGGYGERTRQPPPSATRSRRAPSRHHEVRQIDNDPPNRKRGAPGQGRASGRAGDCRCALAVPAETVAAAPVPLAAMPPAPPPAVAAPPPAQETPARRTPCCRLPALSGSGCSP